LIPLLILLLFLSLLPPSGPAANARVQAIGASLIDRQVGAVGSRLAASSPANAVAWLNRQGSVAGAALGADRATVQIHFRDGAQVAILPAAVRRVPLQPLFTAHLQRATSPAPAPNARAIVLEPFADELNLGPNAGQQEASFLTAAGFTADVKRNTDVTVETMEALTGYSVVYMETHAGALQGGDAIVVTGQVSPAQVNSSPYAGMYAEHSLMQAFVAGQQGQPILYNAITSIFVQQHMGTFSTSSILFLNGCEILAAPVFWSALQAKNAGTLISWDQQVYSATDERAADVVLGQLQKGGTVASAISAAQAQGLGTSIGAGTTAHLGLLGYADNTLAHAMAGDQIPTVTPTLTPVPTATPLPVKKKVKCKRGTKLIHGKCRKVKAKPTATPTPTPKPKPKPKAKHRPTPTPKPKAKAKKHCKKKGCKR
jgi:hypothetical protein